MQIGTATMPEFSAKVVLVTGSTSGIGADVAVSFAREGARVVITGRRAGGLQDTVAKCIEAGASADAIHSIPGDLTKEDDINKVVDSAVEKFGTIDILVNNAGEARMGTLSEMTLDDFDSIFAINVRSVFIMTKRAVPHIVKNKGSIINVGSICGHTAISSCLGYCMSKAAIHQFTQCLAMELAPQGVRVNLVAPGVIKTPIFTRPGSELGEGEHDMEDFWARNGAAHPLGRVGTVDEVSSAILFLASDAASFTTGAIFPVDGGRLCTVSKPAVKMSGE